MQLGKWKMPHIKIEQNLDIFEITERLWWQHFIIQISPQLKCITVEMTKATVGFRTLLPPGCFTISQSSAGAACLTCQQGSLSGLCSSKPCCLLSFFPKICSQGDCNLPPVLSTIPVHSWLMDKETKSRQVLPALQLFVQVLALRLSVLFLSYRCTHTQIHLLTLTHTDLYCMVWGHQNVNNC